ncbi:MAG: hypothetical protein BWY57_00632 [Betaproteobacteria bacterium ADurb.Bin341]|nr:MAG: hypothetical protein BWY57_00632 [Betaproteobacteria bacterium ADurb.Bin341]
MHHSTRSRLLTTFAGAFSALLASSAQAGSIQQKPCSTDTYFSQYATGLKSAWDDEERAKLWFKDGCLTIGSQVKLIGFGYSQSNAYCHSTPEGRILPRTDTVFGTDPYGKACDPGADAVTLGVPSGYRDVPLFPATIPFNHASDGDTMPNAFGLSFNIPVDANGIATSPTGTLSVTVKWDDYSRNKVIVVMYPLRRADMVTLKRTTTYGMGYVFGLKNNISVDYTPPSSEGPGLYTASYTTRYNMVYDAKDILTESLGAGYIEELLEPINKYNGTSRTSSPPPTAFEDLRTPGQYFFGVLNLAKPVSAVPASASATRFPSSSLYSQISAADTNAASLAGLNTSKLARQYIPVGDCTSKSALTLRPDVLRSKLDAAISAHRTLNLNGTSAVWQDFRAGKQEVEMPKLQSTTSTESPSFSWLKQTLTPGGSYVTHISPDTGLGWTGSVAPDSVTPPVMLAVAPLESFFAKDADADDPDPERSIASFSNRFGLSHAYLINRLSLDGIADKTLSMQPYAGYYVPGSNTAGKPLMWHWGSSDRRFTDKGWAGDCWYDRLLGAATKAINDTQTLSGVEPGYYLVRVVGVRYHRNSKINHHDREDYGMGQTYFVVRLGVATSEPPPPPPPPPKGIREFAFANVSTANGAALGPDKLFTYDATTKKFVPTAVARQEALKNGDFRERVTFDGPMTPEEAANWDVQNSANFCYELVKETDAENGGGTGTGETGGTGGNGGGTTGGGGGGRGN